MARFKLAEVEGSVMLPPCATDVLVSKAVQQKRSAKHKAVEGSSIPALQRTDDRKMNGERRDKGEDVGEEEDGDGDDNNKNVNVDVDVDEDEEPSIQQKLVALGISQGDGDFGASKAFPNASGEKSILGSRANVLMQAIRAQDQSLFDDTIEKMRDVKLIRTTVERLPQSVAAGDLLDMLVDRLQRFPTKAETLARWIREVLMEHTGALMSQQRNKALVALVEIVKERTQALEGLSRLQGRLELVLTRADKLKRAGRTMTGDAEPKAQYEEEEGSEDESDESSDDSDSEAGSEDAEDETGELDSEQSSSEDGSGSEMEDVAVRVPERAPRQGDIAMKKMNGHGPGDKIGSPDSSSDEI
ncbi:unnamed protein product [Chondrus crispus]|uniref:Small-subunit processome Utp12 domain-containing protein n=1 Tax=Chondrus crispus TaxID=2769 RepID=R7QQR4_CHOCR|nr:unnamed protein product [Chondrus crispus]CDF39826.1 unnamed protein product [Chondrus crispus]|eukprot:XP_005710120.1 unnamed protein product [Chondrus crispus]